MAIIRSKERSSRGLVRGTTTAAAVLAAGVAWLAFTGSADAQQPPPPPPTAEQPPPPPPTQPPPPPPPGHGQPPPPGHGQPPRGQGYPPPPPAGYGYPPPPPPGYGYGVPPEAMGPEEMDYEPGQPIPPGYHKEEHIKGGLVAAGVPMFAGAWMISVMIGSIGYSIAEDQGGNDADENESNWIPMFIPLAGPAIAIGTLEPNAPAGFWLGFDTAVQTAGLVMFIVGLAATDEVLVRNDVSEPTIQVTPVVGANGSGMALGGTF